MAKEEKELKKTTGKKETKKKNTKKTTKKNIKKESFMKGFEKEVSQIKWPTFKESTKYTIATIIFCIIFIAFFEVLNLVMAVIKGMFN